jgi:hypothetical protein
LLRVFVTFASAPWKFVENARPEAPGISRELDRSLSVSISSISSSDYGGRRAEEGPSRDRRTNNLHAYSMSLQ